MAEVVRPWKVWSIDRKLKKSITASNLQELIEKGCSKLGLSPAPQLRVVLEQDGTEVDDDEYLSLLPSNTAFLFLQNNQRWWYTDWIAPEARDETDASNAASEETVTSNAASGETDDLDSLIASLRWNPENIHKFTVDQIEQMVARDESELDKLIWESRRYCTSGPRKHVRATRRACRTTLPRHHVLHRAVPWRNRK